MCKLGHSSTRYLSRTISKLSRCYSSSHSHDIEEKRFKGVMKGVEVEDGSTGIWV